MIKMAKSFRIQQEIKKISDDEILLLMHMGKTIKVQTKTDKEPREMNLEVYDKR